MKLATVTQVSIDGVVQGNGGASDQDRRNGFHRGGWARGMGDEMTLLTIPVVVGQGTRLFPDQGPDLALDLVASHIDSRGVTIQVLRPAGPPQYAPAT